VLINVLSPIHLFGLMVTFLIDICIFYVKHSVT
jgi:hypothetical protein